MVRQNPHTGNGQTDRKRSLQRQARRRATLPLRPRPNDHEPTRSLPFLPLLSGSPYRTSRHVLYLYEFLDGKYHAGRFGRIWMIHCLHASSQAECSKRALHAFYEGNGGAPEGYAEVCVWVSVV